MRTGRMLLVIAYTGYLVYAGLTLLLLPWHDAWSVILVRLPPRIAALLDLPSVRGVISAFGGLHLLLLACELWVPAGIRGELTGRGARATTGDDREAAPRIAGDHRDQGA